MARNSEPSVVRLSKEAIDLLPEGLRSQLPAGYLAYAVSNDADGSVFVSACPHPVGHICSYVPASCVEALKPARKAVRLVVRLTAGEQKVMLSAFPTHTVTPEEGAALIKAAVSTVSVGGCTDLTDSESLIKRLNEYCPAEFTPLATDLDVAV